MLITIDNDFLMNNLYIWHLKQKHFVTSFVHRPCQTDTHTIILPKIIALKERET